MKKLIIILIVFITVFSDLYAGPGDTTWVQTFSFSDITKRRGWYVFPDDSMRWEKILMLYTLKCDPATTHDQYPCGEWDYTTYTHLYQYDGFDNPCYYVNTLLPDSIPLSYNPVYTYYQNYQYSMVIDNTISENAYLSGTAGSAVQHALQSGIRNNRAQYLWTAAEMTASGMTAGDINKLILDIQATGPELKYLKIKMKNSALAEISPGSYESGLTTVYAQNTMITSTGPAEIILTTPFYWDGTSNMLIEFSFSNSIAGTDFQVAGEDAGFNCGVYSLQDDPFLSFFQYDYVEVPAGAFATIDSFITIAFWQYGDTAIQPTNSYIFEGKNASNYRVINCHLPWSNSRVYWDAGNSATSSYDRIDKDALPEEYKGKWNHWALTKNVATGEMKMYLNGSLWHSGSGFTRTMAGIDKFKIAGRADEVGHYDGFINDFSVWDIDLDSAEINACMFRDIDPSHPEYSHLKAYYRFDENSGITAFDSSPNGYDALLVGLPGWKDTRGEEQFRNLQGTTERPVLSFVSGSYTSHIDSVLVNDSLVNAQVSVIEKQPYIDFGNSGMSFTVLDTIWG
ncbi:MAG: LamG domain-containing protein, partial [Bacteroidota bacterium]